MLFLIVFYLFMLLVVYFLIKEKLPKLHRRIQIPVIDHWLNQFENLVLGEQELDKALERKEYLTEIPKEDLSPKEKGNLFEYHIVDLLPKHYTIENWRSDKMYNGRWAKSNSYPDLELNCYSNQGRKPFTFSIECKYRSSFSKAGKITIAEKYQIEGYRTFARKRKQKVYVALGLGGSPDQPEELFFIPLRQLRSNVVSREDIEAFRREEPQAEIQLDLNTFVLN